MQPIRRLGILICSVLLAVSSGCASNAAKPVPLPEFSAMPARCTQGDVQLGGDAYAQSDRQAAVFDAELGKCGVLPIQLVVQNMGQRAVWVRSTEVRLDFADGTELSPIDVFTVGRCGSALAAGEQPPPIVAPTHPMWGLGPQAGSMAGLIGAAVGVTSLAAAEAGAKDPRVAHYQRIELRGALLRQHESTHGFIFFHIPQDKQLPDTAELVVRLNDAVDESSFSVRLPLSGLILQAGSPGATDAGDGRK